MSVTLPVLPLIVERNVSTQVPFREAMLRVIYLLELNGVADVELDFEVRYTGPVREIVVRSVDKSEGLGRVVPHHGSGPARA